MGPSSPRIRGGHRAPIGARFASYSGTVQDKPAISAAQELSVVEYEHFILASSRSGGGLWCAPTPDDRPAVPSNAIVPADEAHSLS